MKANHLAKILAIACAFSDPVLAQTPRSKAAQEYWFQVLDSAKIDRQSSTALIKAIEDVEARPVRDHSVALAATFALGSLPKAPEIVTELTRLIDSRDDLTVVGAADSLTRLGETQWTRRGLSRLPSLRSDAARMRLCAILAEAGEYSAWPMFKEALTGLGAKGEAGVALSNIYSFAGMKDANGRPVDLAAELALLAPSIRVELQPMAKEMLRSMREGAAQLPAAK